ncbi:MAG: sulfite exporter TauE/SafE family protein [Candidatus Bathyarchaeia archaeon]
MVLDSLLLALSAFLISLIASMLGIGGGVLIVPLLTLVMGLTTQAAVGTSIVSILFLAISSTISNHRQKIIDYKTSSLMALGSIPGGAVGAYATKLVSSSGLGFIFGATLILISLRFFKKLPMGGANPSGGWRRRITDSKGEVFEYTVRAAPGVAMSFIAGFASGFLGLGGGVVMVPVLRFVVGFPMHLAVVASLFIMIFTSLSGVMIHLQLGHVVHGLAAALVLGTILGAQAGSRLVRKVSSRNLERLFGSLLFLVGVRMAVEWLL